MHLSILPQTPLQSSLAHNIEQSSMCYTIGLCWLSILNIAVLVYQLLIYHISIRNLFFALLMLLDLNHLLCQLVQDLHFVNRGCWREMQGHRKRKELLLLVLVCCLFIGMAANRSAMVSGTHPSGCFLWTHSGLDTGPSRFLPHQIGHFQLQTAHLLPHQTGHFQLQTAHFLQWIPPPPCRPLLHTSSSLHPSRFLLHQ